MVRKYNTSKSLPFPPVVPLPQHGLTGHGTPFVFHREPGSRGIGFKGAHRKGIRRIGLHTNQHEPATVNL